MSRLRLASLLLPLALAAGALQAKDEPPLPADPQVLDFMADWQDSQGQWVDPMTFARIDPAKVRTEAERHRDKSRPPAAGSETPPSGAGRAAVR